MVFEYLEYAEMRSVFLLSDFIRNSFKRSKFAEVTNSGRDAGKSTNSFNSDSI